MELKKLQELDLDELNEQEDKTWAISDVGMANWAIKKILEEQQRLEIYEEATKSEIEMLKEKLTKEKALSESRTSWLRFKLNEWLDTQPAKTTKTKKSLRLPSGTISRVFEKETFKPLDAKRINDSNKVLEYCAENAQEFIETKQSVTWAELKKNLEISGDKEIKTDVVDMDSGEVIEKVVPPHTVYNKNTMEVVDCIGVEYVPAKIEVK